jgi:hypothetical protein
MGLVYHLDSSKNLNHVQFIGREMRIPGHGKFNYLLSYAGERRAGVFSALGMVRSSGTESAVSQ